MEYISGNGNILGSNANKATPYGYSIQLDILYRLHELAKDHKPTLFVYEWSFNKV